LQIRSSGRRLHSPEREVKIDLFEWRYDSAQWWLQAGNQAGFLNKHLSTLRFWIPVISHFVSEDLQAANTPAVSIHFTIVLCSGIA
jgi:hypothetical protein